MSWVNLTIDLSRAAKAMERIADALSRAYPSPTQQVRGKMIEASDLIVLDEERLWEMEQEREKKKEEGQEEQEWLEI